MKEKIDSFGAAYHREVLPVIFRYPQVDAGYGPAITSLVLRYIRAGRLDEIEEFVSYVVGESPNQTYPGFDLNFVCSNIQKVYDKRKIEYLMTPEKLGGHIRKEICLVVPSTLVELPFPKAQTEFWPSEFQTDPWGVFGRMLEKLEVLSDDEWQELEQRLKLLNEAILRDPKLDALAADWKTPEGRSKFRSQEAIVDSMNVIALYGYPFRQRVGELVEEVFNGKEL